PASAVRSSRFDDGVLADHDDAAWRDDEALAVALEIDSDLGAFGDADVLVQDRVADYRVAPDVDAVEEHGAVDVCVRVHMDAGGQHRASDPSPRHDHARADE